MYRKYWACVAYGLGLRGKVVCKYGLYGTLVIENGNILMARDQRTKLGSSVAHRHLSSLVQCLCELILRTFGETECSIVNSDRALW